MKMRQRIVCSSLAIAAILVLLAFSGMRAIDPTPPLYPKVEVTPLVTPTPIPEEEDWRLLLVNAETALPEDFTFRQAEFEKEIVDIRILSSLARMLGAAKEEGLQLWVASAYRDVETQKIILENATQNRMQDYGMTEKEAFADARLTIAEAGHSEHHTGLTVDFNTVSAAFEDTMEYAWLQEHSAEYGFVQRYPSGKEEHTGIEVESWHYRFVGAEHAKAMVEKGLCLEEYLAEIKA